MTCHSEARLWKFFKTLHLATGAIAVGIATQVQPVLAADFSDERIEAVVPFGEGGGADTYTRYMVRNLGPKLPGNPTMIVRNIPGGGSVNGANWFEANAKQDGTHIAVASTATTMTSALEPDDPRIQYKPQTWQAFLASPMGRVIYAHSSTGITSIDDLKNFDGQLIMAVDSPTGGDMPSILSLHMLGLDVKAVFGTDGGDASLGFERGEFTIDSDVTSAFAVNGQRLVDEGTAIPLFTFGFEKDGKIERDPNFPDLPSFPEVYEAIHGVAPSGPGFEAWTALFRMAVMSSKVLVLPSGVPEDVAATYDEAAEALAGDETFLDESGEVIGTYPQVTGKAASELLRSASSISHEARDWISEYLRQNFGYDL